VIREGLPVATLDSGPGPFRVEYDRPAEDASSFALRAEAPGRSPVLLGLPARAFDAGEIRLLAGLTYGGRLVDGSGRPVAGAVVALLQAGEQMALSAPSKEDGAFLLAIPDRAYLGGLLARDTSYSASPPRLDARLRGRLFLPVPAVPEGLVGGHEVVLEERPIAIRIRVLDGPTGRPLAGAGVALLHALRDWATGGLAAPAAQVPLDDGVTDESGLFAPLWPHEPERVLLRVRAPDGRTVWTVLHRTDAEGLVPRDITVPAEPVVVAVRCVAAADGRPVPGAEVVVGVNAGTMLRGVTDGRGEARWAFAASDTVVRPEDLQVASWQVTWRDAGGLPRREFRWDAPWDAMRPEDPGSEDARLVPNEPLVIRLGERPDPGMWIAVGGEGADRAAPPEQFRVEAGAATAGWWVVAAQFSGPWADPASGRTLWWTWQQDLDATFASIPAGKPLRAELQVRGRPPLFVPVDRARLLAANRAEGAIVFEVAPPDAMTRTLLVTGPGGRPVPGALVVVLAGRTAARWNWDEKERERRTTGPDGRVTLNALEASGDCRILAWDPASGAGAMAGAPDQAAPPDRWRLVLEEARPLRLKVRLAEGGVPWRSTLSLQPLCRVLPLVPAADAKDGEIASPPVPFGLYSAYVSGIISNRDYRFATGAPADLDGTEVVLAKSR
jgi:hypothetical protein